MNPTAPIDDSVLRRAVSLGVLTPAQSDRLRALAAEDVPEPRDDEALRFITGFNDIFVTIGIGLFLGALGYLVRQAAGDPAASGAVTAAAWLLAEYFTRKRRLALPSIALTAVFVLGASAAMASMLENADYGLTLSALTGLLAAALHYWRFHVPITVAAGVAGACAAIIVLPLGFAWNSAQMVRPYVPFMVLILGIAVFALAMRFDLKDPHRLTRNTDIAFWLHLLAAPLIVHPLIVTIAGPGMGEMETVSALAVLGVFLALSLLALVVDRRAILVSGLAYAGIAFIKLVGLSGDTSWPLTMLVLGVFVLGLSAGWRSSRRALLSCLPVRLSARLPHPLASG